MAKHLQIILMVVMMVVIATPVRAEQKDLVKIKRGIVNVVTAPIEIPKNFRAYWIEGSAHTPHILVWLFCGTVKGVVETIKRAGSGAWDLFSVGYDHPKNNEPLIKPDYVFQDWPQRDPAKPVAPLLKEK